MRILVHRFEGRTFLAADTGGLIKGQRIDVFMPSCERAIAFGAQHVRIDILPQRQPAAKKQPLSAPASVPALSRLLRGRHVTCLDAYTCPWYNIATMLGDSTRARPRLTRRRMDIFLRPAAFASRAY